MIFEWNPERYAMWFVTVYKGTDFWFKIRGAYGYTAILRGTERALLLLVTEDERGMVGDSILENVECWEYLQNIMLRRYFLGGWQMST